MTLEQLQYFVAIVESATFFDAAEAFISLSPPCPNRYGIWNWSWTSSCLTEAAATPP